MSVSIYYDNDVDLSIVRGKRLAFVGYGNHGAAQVQNLRESGVAEIVIGNRDDEYKQAALEAGFRAMSIAEATAWGEAILYEMYLSKEPAEIFERFAELGAFGQLPLHSHTSQYGQLRALLSEKGEAFRERFMHVLHDDILSGAFVREWSDVQARGPERLEQLRAAALGSPLARAEASILKQSKK